jgi:hypothetical protein
LIPYGESDSEKNAVIVSENFSELVRILVPADKAVLECNLVFNEESVASGN